MATAFLTDDHQPGKAMIVKIQTEKSVPEAAAALEATVKANQFGVMHIHDLKATMQKKGVEFSNQCLIFEVCQPEAT